jgi:hypothetical protein
MNFERLVASGLVREGDCTVAEAALPPAPPPVRRVRPSRSARGSHLQLVVSQALPASAEDQLAFSGNDALTALLEKCEAEHGGRFGV